MAPDLGTNEQTMAWMMDTYSVHAGHKRSRIVTGKPVGLAVRSGARGDRSWGRLPRQPRHGHPGLGEQPMLCGRPGVRKCRLCDRILTGQVRGQNTRGQRRPRGVFNDKGLDLLKLDQHLHRHNTVTGFPEAEPITNDQLLLTPCDILVPAAVERQITRPNAKAIHCRILAEAANGPTTPEADAILAERDHVFVIPDISATPAG